MYLLIFLAISVARTFGFAFPGPAPTDHAAINRDDMAMVGMSPAPTPRPRIRGAPALFRRQEITDSRTCGYFTEDYYDPGYTCSRGSECFYDTTASWFGCCEDSRCTDQQTWCVASTDMTRSYYSSDTLTCDFLDLTECYTFKNQIRPGYFYTNYECGTVGGTRTIDFFATNDPEDTANGPGTSSPEPAGPISTPVEGPGGQGPVTPPPNPTPDPKPESKAWIAGAVVGPLVGLALIGAGIFFLMRRKKNKQNNQHVAPASGSVPAPGASAYQQTAYNNNPGSPQPPQYYPNMQQTGAAAPYGTGKPDGTAPPPWQQGPQPVYDTNSRSMSPQPQSPQVAQYNAGRHFSTELDGSGDAVSVQPKH